MLVLLSTERRELEERPGLSNGFVCHVGGLISILALDHYVSMLSQTFDPVYSFKKA